MKWDGLEAFFGVGDALPMWVADMDFRCPPEVTEAVAKRADHGIYGYAYKDDEYYEAVIEWWSKRHSWSIAPQWILTSPGTISALAVAIETFTKPGDGVIIQPPVYPPFERTIRLMERQPVYNKLENRDGKYAIDLEGLEHALRAGARMLVLCSPHNPVGRVWTEEELQALAGVLERFNVLVFDDELHADIVYAPNKHAPLLKVAPQLSDRTIVATSVSKTFNLAGLENTNLVIVDDSLRQRMSNALMAHAMYRTNLFAIVATKAAYKHGEAWLDTLLSYLSENLDVMRAYFSANLPELKWVEPEGTYLAWLSVKDLGFNSTEAFKRVLHEGHVAVQDGKDFGPGGEWFLRLNFATPRELLVEALHRIARSLK